MKDLQHCWKAVKNIPTPFLTNIRNRKSCFWLKDKTTLCMARSKVKKAPRGTQGLTQAPACCSLWCEHLRFGMVPHLYSPGRSAWFPGRCGYHGDHLAHSQSGVKGRTLCCDFRSSLITSLSDFGVSVRPR